MADPKLSIHKAVYQALQAMSVSVYDAVPQGAAFPYVTLDSVSHSNVDNLSDRIDEAFVFLSFWSQQRGQAQVLSLIGEASELLHDAQLSLDSGRMARIRVDSSNTQRDADNVTFMGSMTLRILVNH